MSFHWKDTNTLTTSKFQLSGHFPILIKFDLIKINSDWQHFPPSQHNSLSNSLSAASKWKKDSIQPLHSQSMQKLPASTEMCARKFISINYDNIKYYVMNSNKLSSILNTLILRKSQSNNTLFVWFGLSKFYHWYRERGVNFII